MNDPQIYREVGGEYQEGEMNVLDFAPTGNRGGSNTNQSTNSSKYRRHISTVVDNDHSHGHKKGSRKSISMVQSKQGGCCDGGCIMF